METKTGLAVGLNKGHITTPLEKKVKPSYRKGVCNAVPYYSFILRIGSVQRTFGYHNPYLEHPSILIFLRSI